jgi:hypothetical protein
MIAQVIYSCSQYRSFNYTAGKILADYICCVCKKRKTAKGNSGYEKLQKCTTENGAKAFQQAAAMSPSKLVSSEIAGCDWQTILARELYYHRSWYTDLTRKRNTPKDNCSEKAFQDVKQFIEEKVLNKCEVLRLADLAQLYVESKSTHSKIDCQLCASTAQKLKKESKKHLARMFNFGVQIMGVNMSSITRLRKDI